MIYSTLKTGQRNYREFSVKFVRSFLYFIFLSVSVNAFSQQTNEIAVSRTVLLDSLKNKGVIFNDKQKKPEILFSRDQAARFLKERTQPLYWIDPCDPLRMALIRLLYETSHQRFDSVEYFLKRYQYDSLNIPWDKFSNWDTLRLKIPVIAHTELPVHPDFIVKADVNLSDAANDSSGIESLAGRNPYSFFPYQGDSIRGAVKSLIKYLEERDSTLIRFSGIGRTVIPLWMNSKSDTMVRYWLKNEFSDSVTVWIGNTLRDTIGLFLEQGVYFRRLLKQGNYSKPKINIKSLDNSKLLALQKILVKPLYWKYRSEASFILSQSALSNWVRGGENSVSFLTDITSYADYNNKDLKVSSNNFVRFKLGFLKSGPDPVRKNLDLIETNSKLNHKAFGKFDFSAILLFKTQTFPGYEYSRISDRDTAILVSKFMNPAILVVGIGLDFKPNKETSINFSPLSYKGTFVTDTSRIDQTKYGILKKRKSLNEPGVSFMISHDFRPVKNLTITNRLQLFTNYIKNPQNIDVDWEMIALANLNWFTDVRFNTHLIFDDDTRTVELDKNKQPVLRPDGTVKKTARIQFKEMLGFSLVFRF